MYERASSQKVNYDKSLLYFDSNVAHPVKIFENPEKYLKLPTMVVQAKKKGFMHFVDRFKSRLDSWNMRFLSASGKETVIKSFLQSLSVYSMRCFFIS